LLPDLGIRNLSNGYTFAVALNESQLACGNPVILVATSLSSAKNSIQTNENGHQNQECFV